MKAIIPVAGAGTKLRPLTYTQPKPLIPIAGKPIIAHILDKLIEAGIDEFIFVVGYLADKIQIYLEKHYPDIQKSFAIQSSRMGLGHAIWTAREFLDAEKEVVIVLGDTILDLDFNKFLSLDGSALGVKKVQDPTQFGVVELDDNGHVKKLIEKPNIPKSNLAISGIYKIREVKELLEALEYNVQNEVRTHGEFQLTDGLMGMVMKGINIKVKEVDNWYDCGQRDILLETNARMLELVDQNFNEKYPDSIIIQPVSIGQDANIENSIIGPYVSIGSHATIRNSIIQNSIVGDFSGLNEVILDKSVVGQDVTMNGMKQSLNIGDNTEIDFSK